jgi:hypothetical protein
MNIMGRIAPENYTINHNRMKIWQIILPIVKLVCVHFPHSQADWPTAGSERGD